MTKRKMNYHDPEYIKKQRESHSGEKNPNWKHGKFVGGRPKKGYNPNSAFKKGHHFGRGNPKLVEHRKKLSEATRKHYDKLGPRKTSANMLIRCGKEFLVWRKAVFERDGYTCMVCGKVGGKLNAHHIKSFKDYPELRFIVDNGITLCLDCHRLTDNYCRRRP